jgi:hypothetical protein
MTGQPVLTYKRSVGCAQDLDVVLVTSDNSILLHQMGFNLRDTPLEFRGTSHIRGGSAMIPPTRVGFRHAKWDPTAAAVGVAACPYQRLSTANKQCGVKVVFP